MLLDRLAGRASRCALRPGLAGLQKQEDALLLRVDKPKTLDTKMPMLSGLVHCLRRTSFTLLFARRGTTRPRKSIDKARPQLLGHDAPSRLESSSSRRRAARLTISSDLLRTTKKKYAFEEPCLAHSRGGCSCAVAQVDTMPEAWKVMGRRWKTAKFVQAHNELAARRGAPLATINPPRIRSTTRALQEYRRTQLAPLTPRACCNAPPRDASLRATMHSDSPHFPSHGAASKLLPFSSPIDALLGALLGASCAEQEGA